jgi:molybdopterin-guanine dinucleotide biosynthesis protein A
MPAFWQSEAAYTQHILSLYGLVLAGGKSSRMGFNKIMLDFHGEPQVVWLHKLLQSFCSKVFVSGRPDIIPGEFEFIEDHYESGGPMNGILSAMRLHPSASWLVVPVDMPNVDGAVIRFMLAKRDESKTATYFTDAQGQAIEPLPIILEASAFQLLMNRFEQGEASLNKFLKSTQSIPIIAQDPKWLINVNSPEQL